MEKPVRDRDYFRAASKKSYQKYRERILAERKKLWEEKKEIINERNLDYYYKNQEMCKEKQAEYREAKRIAKELDL
jgi:hypothetical protein